MILLDPIAPTITAAALIQAGVLEPVPTWNHPVYDLDSSAGFDAEIRVSVEFVESPQPDLRSLIFHIERVAATLHHSGHPHLLR
jgi:hypothetical protein